MFWEFLGSAVLGGSLAAIGLAVAGYLARAQLAHWLNQDLERVKASYQKELEADKALFQRELEAYKVSLIAEAERAKAVQEVKRASALTILEMEFATLRQLHAATLGLGVAISGAAQKLKQYRTTEQFDEVHARYKALGDAIYAIAIFTSPDEHAMLRRYEVALTRVLFPHCTTHAEAVNEEEYAPLRREMFTAELAVDEWIAGKLRDLRKLD